MANEELKISKDKFVPAIIDANISEAINKPSLNFWQDAWLRIRKNKAALVSYGCNGYYSLFLLLLVRLLVDMG